jgi:1-deoxy-D-xylulose-5-phosphate reductoisomerase
MEEKKRSIAVLGSTGSIGTQALDVIRKHSDLFEAEILTAHNNADLLIKQAVEFQPNAVVITNKNHYEKVKSALQPFPIKVYAGFDSLEQIVESDTIDMVLAAIVGIAGLKSTYNAVKHKKTLALANKETLVVAGDIITKLAQENSVNIFPVDSEHSAIFQCLAGEFHNKIEKIILTASGGPFRNHSLEELKNITKEQALDHPNWKMGSKITIDSATLVNKGLEVIEARWLFGVPAENIQVVIHPQSVIHSMVQFSDGSIKAQMGLPDMRLPILYALGYPARLTTDFPRYDFSVPSSLTFDIPDTERFPGLLLAFEALKSGGNKPCILNAANEEAVMAFLQGRISFTDIHQCISYCLEKATFVPHPSLHEYLQTDEETRKICKEKINTIK